MFDAELHSRCAADIGGEAEYTLVNINRQIKGANMDLIHSYEKVIL